MGKRKRSKKRSARPKKGLLLKNQRFRSVFIRSKPYRVAVLKHSRVTPLLLERSENDQIIKTTVKESATLRDITGQHEQFIKGHIANYRKLKVCNSRNERRKILFSKGKAGSGKKIRKRKRYNDNSKVRC